MSLDLCLIIISPMQFSSVAQFCLTLCDPMDCSMPGFPVHHQLPEPAQTHVCRVGDTINHLILCVPFYSCLQSFPASVFFQWVSFCIMWPKYWSFSFSISPSNEYLGLISFRMDWLDLLAVQGTLQESSLTPQFRSINSSVLSFLYGPTLTSIHDYIQNILSALKSSVLCVFISLPPKLQAPGKHWFEPFIVSVVLP